MEQLYALLRLNAKAFMVCAKLSEEIELAQMLGADVDRELVERLAVWSDRFDQTRELIGIIASTN